jgi:hypothetical protein
MTDDFEVGEFDPDIAENWGNETENESASTNFKVRVRKYELCPGSMREYIPCLDNVEAIKRLKLTEKGERFERHCPEKGKGLNCLVPPPKGYRQPIPWPRSRDEVLGSKWGLFCRMERIRKETINLSLEFAWIILPCFFLTMGEMEEN